MRSSKFWLGVLAMAVVCALYLIPLLMSGQASLTTAMGTPTLGGQSNIAFWLCEHLNWCDPPSWVVYLLAIAATASVIVAILALFNIIAPGWLIALLLTTDIVGV